MDYKTEFPLIFKKILCVKLNRVKLSSPVNDDKTKTDEQNISSVSRRTRSQKDKDPKVDWVRVLKGEYKGDLGRVELLDLKNNTADVKLFPRIDYGSIGCEPSLSNRRPAMKSFDVEFMRYATFLVDFIQRSLCLIVFADKMVKKF